MASRSKRICVEKATDNGIIVAGLEIVKSCFVIVAITTVAKGNIGNGRIIGQLTQITRVASKVLTVLCTHEFIFTCTQNYHLN